jgi:hypothetical protein
MTRRKPAPGGAEHPIIAALFRQLPAPGSVWPYPGRQNWLSAMQAAFNLIYVPPMAPTYDVGVGGPDYVPPAVPPGGIPLSGGVGDDE